jgi:hypothetical protein
MRVRVAVLAVAASLVTACAATPPPVEGAADSINAVTMTCNRPYVLKQDCSIWNGATRRITIDGFHVKVAGSEDGTVVLVMDANMLGNQFGDFFTINSPSHSEASNHSYHAVRRVLDEAGIEVIRVRPLRSFGDINGYVLELAADGYSLLRTFSR